MRLEKLKLWKQSNIQITENISQKFRQIYLQTYIFPHFTVEEDKPADENQFHAFPLK
jgi:polyribonucleotide nucleotidyltransferase